MSLRRMYRRALAHGAMNDENPIGLFLMDEYVTRAIRVWYLYRLYEWGK